MFDNVYLEWNQKRIKCIIDHYSHTFMYGKSLLDLGCGHADIGGAMHRLGADVTAVDARQEHLKIVSKKFSGIKTVKADLDRGWPFQGRKFDVALDLALLCHLREYEAHLKDVCSACRYLILETAVCDSADPNKCIMIKESKFIYENSVNGFSARPSAAAIEQVLTNCGFTFKRMDSAKLNAAPFVYDWQSKNDDGTDINHRRLWFAEKINPTVSGNNMSRNPHSPYEGGSNANNPQSPYEIKNSHQPAHKPLLHPIPRPPVHYTPPIPQTKRIDILSTYIPAVKNNYNYLSNYFSVLPTENYQPSEVFNVSGTIQCNTFKAAQWINKILPIFPNLKITKSINLLKQRNTNETPNVILGALGSLSLSNRIWIEEFQGITPSKEDLDILNQAVCIMSPSLPNVQYFRNKLPNKIIIYAPKLWPLIKIDNFIPTNKYIIYFEKNTNMTQLLTSIWSSNMPQLIVIGSKLNLPDNATHVSPYATYSEIISLIMNSGGLIDLNINNHYFSGILDLAHSYGINITTNNQWLKFAKPVPEYISSTQIIDNMLMPGAGDLSVSISKMLTKQNTRYNLENYNLNIDACLKTILGLQ